MSRYGPAEPVIRLCTICGEQLPAGKQFHVPLCAEIHRQQLKIEGKLR